MALGDCLGKNKVLTEQDKAALLARSQEYQKSGMSEKEADMKALSDEQAKIVEGIKQVHKQLGLKGTTRGKIQSQPSEPTSGQPPAPPTTTTPSTASNEPAARQFALGKRVEESGQPTEVKSGLKTKGDTYIPKGLNLTEEQAAQKIKELGPEASEAAIRDTSNGISGDTRSVMAGQLFDQYTRQAEAATDPQEKTVLYEKAVDLAFWAENFLMQSGRTSNTGKFWKKILQSGEDQIVMAVERQNRQQADNLLGPIQNAVAMSKQQIEAEIRRLVEKGVQEQVGKRLEKAKLISESKKKQIGDFFDKLKINTKGGIATATILPIGVLPHVWNASLDIIKQAILTGADVANAIQAGIDYIKANQKEPFDEEKFKQAVQPGVEQLLTSPVKAENINEQAVETPKIKGKKKKDFIQSVVDAYNEGKLTDQKFNDLYAKQLGYRKLSAEDKAKVRELAKTISTAEKFEKDLRENFTPEGFAKLKELREAAIQANQHLQNFATTPNKLSDTLIAIMQGNVMSVLSLVSNVFYNLTFQPIRFMSTASGQFADYMMSQMAKLGMLPETFKDRTIDLVAAQKGYFKGGWSGTIEGLNQLKTGAQANERNLREIHSNFNPGRAIERWVQADRSLSQKINDAIEGTIGWEAEAMFRALNLGDKPWRRAAEMAKAYELAKLKGLTGAEAEKFIALPDEESQAEITKAGEESTFQQQGHFGQNLQRGIASFLNMIEEKGGPLLGGAAKVLLKSQILFIKTPWNLMSETLQYAAPPITLGMAIHQANLGNKRQASVLAGKAMVGTMIWSVASSLFMRGLLTGDDDKEKKKRDFQAEGGAPPANSINASAISRGLSGHGWETKKDDIWVSYQRMGVLGVLFDNYSNLYKDRVAKTGSMHGGLETYLTDISETGIRTASNALDQTFLSGTSTLLEAIRDGGDEKTQAWLLKTTETLGAIALPNVVASISRASDTYSRDIKDDSFGKKLVNTYKTKLFIGESLPAKVNIWGDKITGAPEGRNKAFYYLFDPSKFRAVDTDGFRFKLYEAWKTDYSGDWLPQSPTRKITYNGQSRQLTGDEYSLLAQYVGQQRANYASSYIKTWDNDSPETRKKTLRFLYDKAADLGRDQFLTNTGLNVKTKVTLPIDVDLLKWQMNQVKKSSKPNF